MMKLDSALSRASNHGLRAMRLTALVGIATLVAMGIAPHEAKAWRTWSAEKVTHPPGTGRCAGSDPCEVSVGNCQTCHGQFPATNSDNPNPYFQDEYISPADGETWSAVYKGEERIGLHNLHRFVIADEDSDEDSKCSVCHTGGHDERWPVYLNSSTGTPALDGALDGISCAGCHGREQDLGGDDGSTWGAGYAAGLRQHHTNAGINVCMTCHADAAPARFTPAEEHVLPPYYAVSNDVFVNKPTDSCNWFRNEDYAGSRTGLDNDGDGRYDWSDPDCWWWARPRTADR
jgi:hypothetical protein